MSAPPEVSVVIPTHDRARLVGQAVESALAQEDVELEVLVVDDASSDETPEVLAGIGDSRLRVHRRAEPGGAGRARNDAIARARAAYVAFLDDDDLWSPNRLRVQLDGLDGGDFAYCAVVLVDPARRPVGVLPAPEPGALRSGLRRASLIGGPSSMLARTDFVREVGGFSGRYHALDDWDMWMRLAARGRAAATAELLVAYTIHESNMHRRDPDAVIRDFDDFTQAHDLEHASRLLFSWLADDNKRAGNWRQAARVRLRSAWRHRDPEELARAAAVWLRRPPPRPDRQPRLVGPPWLERYRERE